MAPTSSLPANRQVATSSRSALAAQLAACTASPPAMLLHSEADFPGVWRHSASSRARLSSGKRLSKQAGADLVPDDLTTQSAISASFFGKFPVTHARAF